MCSACSTHWEERNSYRILVGNPEGNRPIGISRDRRDNNIKLILISPISTHSYWSVSFWISHQNPI
jgi:hypothetical protein